jgi:predicted nucleic acid-binding protein
VILVETSVWVDHLRVGDSTLATLLDAGKVLTHPLVFGEPALGSLRNRDAAMSCPSHLPSSAVATDSEVLSFIDRNALFGRGIGYADVHLLAAARLTAGTNDKRLGAVAEALGLASLEPTRRTLSRAKRPPDAQRRADFVDRV